MEKIDFYAKKRELHQEMVSAIKELLKSDDVTFLDLKDESNKCYATVHVGFFAKEKEIDAIWIVNNILWGKSPEHYIAYNLETEPLYCTIDTIYDRVYEVLNHNK